MSYEMFRADVVANLETKFSEDQIKNVLESIDNAALSYDFKRKEISLSVVNGIPESVRLFIASNITKGLKKGTLENYYYFLRKFFNIVQKQVDDINPNIIRTFLSNYKLSTGITDRTLASKRSILNNFFEWCANEEIIKSNPVKRVEPIKYYSPQRKAMDLEELERVRFSCKNIREKAVIDFLYSTGCRVSELCNMDITDVDFTTRKVSIRKGKGDKDRVSYMNAEAVVSLRSYLDQRTDDCPALIVNWSKSFKHRLHKRAIEVLIRNVCSRAGITWHVVPHHMRHTLATVLIHNGCPIEHVQKLLGHAKLTTTMEYVKLVEDDIHRSHERCAI